MILCKIVTPPDSTAITLVPEGRHFESFSALERAIDKTPEAFEPDTKYTLITTSKVITTKPQTRIQFNTTVEVFPIAGEPKPKPAEKGKPAGDDGEKKKAAPKGKPETTQE